MSRTAATRSTTAFIPKSSTLFETCLDGVPYSEQELFLFTNLDSSESVLQFFPNQKGGGSTKLIPLAFRARSEFPSDAVAMCKKFRQLPQAQQEQEKSRNIDGTQRRILGRNLQLLKTKQRLLARGEMDWEEANGKKDRANPTSTDSVETLTQGLGSLSTSTSTSSSSQSRSPLESLSPNNATAGTNTTATTTTTTHGQQSDMDLDEDDMDENSDPNQHIGGLSPQEDRDRLAATVSRKIRSKSSGEKRHLEDENRLDKVLVASTAGVRRKVHAAQKATAEAIDAMQHSLRYAGAPRTTVVSIFMTENLQNLVGNLQGGPTANETTHWSKSSRMTKKNSLRVLVQYLRAFGRVLVTLRVVFILKHFIVETKEEIMLVKSPRL
jgi:hypothetical protein